MSKNEVPKVSTRDTKSTILAAHEEALKKLATLEKNPRLVAETQKNSEIVVKQSQVSIENIVQDLAQTRLLVTDSLANLEKNLVEKRTQLEEIQISIASEEANLKDAIGVNRQVDSFAALVQAQKDQKLAYDQEVTETRAGWQKELVLHNQSIRERNSDAHKNHQRQNEEYEYKFAKIKEEAQDSFDQEKKLRLRSLEEHEATTINVLKERENAVKTNEIEFNSLKNSVELFTSQLDEAVTKATEDAKSRASKSHGFEVRAIKKDAESTQALFDQKVTTLETQVAGLISERDALRIGLEKSQAEVKDIATEAIKGAQTKNYYTPDSKK